jgi:hypothetical protein
MWDFVFGYVNQNLLAKLACMELLKKTRISTEASIFGRG